MREEVEFQEEGIQIEENKLGDYDYPEFVLSSLEEQRIVKPWERGVIIKILGIRNRIQSFREYIKTYMGKEIGLKYHRPWLRLPSCHLHK